MKFLIDQQLPPALAKFLQRAGHVAHHVRDLNLREADDRAVWKYAIDHDLVMISKDEDFYYLAVSPGSSGKLVWIKIGNCRTHPLIEKLRGQLENIIVALETGSRIVEIR